MRFEEDGSFFRPDRVLVAVLESGGDLRQPGVVVRRLVTGDGFPVKSFGGGKSVRVVFENGVVPALGVAPALVFEVVAR
jgi:hypothetical protein